MRVCPRCSELYPDEVDDCPSDGTPLRAVLDPLIGKTVGGRFRLIQRLGSGGMSSVYLARHVLIDRLMAIKTLRRDLARDPVQRDRFLREARAVNRINHANIVEISDFGETESGLVYLVMEYVPGDSLLKVLGDGPMPALRALDIVEQCGSALARAHQMGVIHRDLKPENILIVQRKERRDFVKLLDFGIAKIIDAPSLTGSQQIFGTPGYIAPEYIQSTDIDGRSDLYSLGCLLYEMVTGALPFDYEYPGDLLVKHVTEPPIPPSQRLPLIEPPVERFVLRCLEKDPANRFRDAFHFLTELAAVRERLGPSESWGGLNEAGVSSRPPRDTTHEDERETVDLVRSLAHAVSPAPDARVGRDTIAEGIPLTMILDQAESGVEEARRAAPSIPQPPALDGSLSPEAVAPVVAERAPPVPPTEAETPARLNRDGLVGALRWRARFDALERHLVELVAAGTPTPADIEHALSLARESLVDLEQTSQSAQAYQEAIEALLDRARDFRGTLGRAIDAVAAELSSERGDFERLVTRRNHLREKREASRVKLRRHQIEEGQADAILWELAAVEEQLRAHGAHCDSLETRLSELRVELEHRNEQFETERVQLVRVLDAQMLRLEAAAGALRRPLELVEGHVRRGWDAMRA